MPSAFCPTAARAERPASTAAEKSSRALKIALPSRTSKGPPASPFTIVDQSGFMTRRMVTAAPTGASSVRRCAVVPRATSTPPPGGIGVRPPERSSVTGAVRTPPGTAVPSAGRTASTLPGSTGVVVPHAGV